MNTSICRICFSEANLQSLFENKDNKAPFEIVMSFTSLKVKPNDGLPPYICNHCLQQSLQCFEFKVQCENSDKKLREQFGLEDLNTDIDYFLHATDIKVEVVKQEGNKDDLSLEILEPGKRRRKVKDRSKRVKRDKTREQEVLEAKTDDGESLLTKLLKAGVVWAKKEQVEKPPYRPMKRQQICGVCGKVLTSKNGLTQHMKVHTGERPYTCKTCGRTFSYGNALRIHNRLHTGERPKKCEFCGRSFRQAATLHSHLRTHTGEKPYRCTICPETFRSTTSREYHLRKHKGQADFKCETCGREFYTHANLRKHYITHTGEKPFVCTICGKGVVDITNLKRHMNRHAGLPMTTVYRCSQCPTTYTKKARLARHIQEAHGAIYQT